MTGPAPAAGAGSSIYDLGYRRYEGPRLGRRHALRALFLHTLKVCYGIGRGGRAKLPAIILGALAVIPAVVTVGAFALLRQTAGEGVPTRESPIGHGTYYEIITTLVVLFCAAQAPETVGRDQRHQLLPLYFSRALRREDYALARWAGVVAALLIFVLLPQLILFLGLVFSAEDVAAELGREMEFLPGILGQGLILAGLLGGLSAVISAFTPRRAYATVGIIVLLAVTPIVSTVLIELGTLGLATLLALASPADILNATNALLFDIEPESSAVVLSQVPLGAFLGTAVAISVACLAILVWRYRRIAA